MAESGEDLTPTTSAIVREVDGSPPGSSSSGAVANERNSSLALLPGHVPAGAAIQQAQQDNRTTPTSSTSSSSTSSSTVDPHAERARSFHVEKEARPYEAFVELQGHTGLTRTARTYTKDDALKALTCADDSTLQIWAIDEKNDKRGLQASLGCDNTELLEHRHHPKAFPDALGPFGIQETMLHSELNKVEIEKLKTDKKIEEVHYNYKLKTDTKLFKELLQERGSLSKTLWGKLKEKAKDNCLTGLVSPMHKITIPQGDRRHYGIPEDSTHFMWGHQLSVLSDAPPALTPEDITDLSSISAEASFALIGGFIYIKCEGKDPNRETFDPKSGDKVLQLNALSVKGLMMLHFGSPKPVDTENEKRAVKKLIKDKRFQPVGITTMREKGAWHYCWLFPGESIAADKDNKVTLIPNGGFIYLCSEGITKKDKGIITEKDEPPLDRDDPNLDNFEVIYFEHTVGHVSPVRSCCLLNTGAKCAIPSEVLKNPNYVLSCSEDATLRCWDLETGVVRKVLAELPDVDEMPDVDGTLQRGQSNRPHHGANVDDHWVTGCCNLGFWDNNTSVYRVLSCSNDGKIRIWKLDCIDCRDSGETVHRSKLTVEFEHLKYKLNDKNKKVEEFDLCGGSRDHEEGPNSVWSCFAFAPDGKNNKWAVSVHNEGQVVLWNLTTGEFRKAETDRNTAIRSCYCYEDNRKSDQADKSWRALTGGDNHTVTVWKLVVDNAEDFQPPVELCKLSGHSNSIAEVCAFKNPYKTTDHWNGVSCSWDGTTRIWELDDEESEEVKGAVFPPLYVNEAASRGCTASLDGSKILVCADEVVRVWDGHFIRAANLDTEKLADVLEDKDIDRSVVDTAELLWKWWPHMATHHHEAWAHKLIHCPELTDKPELTMQLLYGRHRNGMTLLHRLAEDPDGGFVLRYLLESLKEGRRKVVESTAVDETNKDQIRKDRIAEMTIGLICRAGQAHGRSLLKTATKHHNSLFVQILLQDYCLMVRAVKHFEYSKSSEPLYGLFEPMTEHDLVQVFHLDSLAAAEFLKKLELRSTHGLAMLKRVAKNVLHSDHMRVQVSDQLNPKPPDSEEDKRNKLWWDNEIDKTGKDYGEEQQKLPVQTHLVPLQAAMISQSKRYHPFSHLLKKSYEHAAHYDAVDLFDSPSLRAIINFKWHTENVHICFWLAAMSSFAYTLLLTVAIVDGGQGDWGFFDFALWFCTVYLAVLGIIALVIALTRCWRWLLHIRELCHNTWKRNEREDEVPAKLKAFWYKLWEVLVTKKNISFWLTVLKDLYVYVGSLDSVFALHEWSCTGHRGASASSASSASSGAEQCSGWLFDDDTRATGEAMMLLLLWFNVSSWLKGFEDFFFTVKVIRSNVATLLDFSVVLVLVLFVYGVAFSLILQGFTREEIVPSPPLTCMSWSCHKASVLNSDSTMAPGSRHTQTDGVVSSVIHAFGMMQGEFSTQVFEKPWRDALQTSNGFSLDGSLLFWVWASFMLLVPVVMVNILIASMQNSFDAVYAKREAHMLMERSALIVQLERTLPVSFMQRAHKQAHAYLHVISSPRSGLHDGIDRAATHPPGRIEKMGAHLEKSLKHDIREDVERLSGQMASEVSGMQSKLDGIEQLLGRLVENRSLGAFLGSTCYAVLAADLDKLGVQSVEDLKELERADIETLAEKLKKVPASKFKKNIAALQG